MMPACWCDRIVPVAGAAVTVDAEVLFSVFFSAGDPHQGPGRRRDQQSKARGADKQQVSRLQRTHMLTFHLAQLVMPVSALWPIL